MATDTSQSPDALTATRKVRHEISAEIGHEPQRLLEYFQQVQRRQADAFPEQQPVDPRVSADASP